MFNYLKVSTEGYYHFKKRDDSKQAMKRRKIKEVIQRVYDDSYQIYRTSKITEVLHRQGFSVYPSTISAIMKQTGIKVHYRKKVTQTTISVDFDAHFKNVLNRKFNPSVPFSV